MVSSERTSLQRRIERVIILSLLSFVLPVSLCSCSHSREESLVDCAFDSGACLKNAGRDNLSVMFDIEPKPVRAMSELRFRVALRDGAKPVSDATVTLDLSMPGMYMGLNRPVLMNRGEGIYEGKGVIPRCRSGRKVWRAGIEFSHGSGESRKREMVAFTFEVRK